MIPVHVAVEKNIRNAVEEKSKWRIFQLGKVFCSSFNRRDKRQLYGIYKTKNKSGLFRQNNEWSYLKQIGKIKREEMINDRKIILKNLVFLSDMVLLKMDIGKLQIVGKRTMKIPNDFIKNKLFFYPLFSLRFSSRA